MKTWQERHPLVQTWRQTFGRPVHLGPTSCPGRTWLQGPVNHSMRFSHGPLLQAWESVGRSLPHPSRGRLLMWLVKQRTPLVRTPNPHSAEHWDTKVNTLLYFSASRLVVENTHRYEYFVWFIHMCFWYLHRTIVLSTFFFKLFLKLKMYFSLLLMKTSCFFFLIEFNTYPVAPLSVKPALGTCPHVTVLHIRGPQTHVALLIWDKVTHVADTAYLSWPLT